MDYAKLYNALISFRKSNPLSKSKELYTEKHHIVPRCLGGSNSRTNLVRLTAREHFIAHRLLSKIYPRQHSLQVAVWGMMNTRDGARVNSREFHRLKELFSEYISRTNKIFYQNNPEASEKHSKLMKSKNLDPEYRKTNSNAQKKRFEEPEARSKISDSLKEYFNDNPEARLKLSVEAKARMSDPKFLQAHSSRLKQIHIDRGNRPWLVPNARKRTMDAWAMAQLFYNEDISASKFSKIFDCGLHINVYNTMKKKFRRGWVPENDEIWIRDFGHLGIK